MNLFPHVQDQVSALKLSLEISLGRSLSKSEGEMIEIWIGYTEDQKKEFLAVLDEKFPDLRPDSQRRAA
ncbi:hypothetical protein DKP76_13470 [Falsochrobactrum shanghaiense]|uniref:Uncharacterized protein n=1 Tax=Falsochrobactrum shanghaiense TaxID=2201899 RepID=A0A316J531_9HYPH|nr:hypothetical protein [Falsochrobactrum shanghaiense]PWL17042.1 hypothetical protein DKP76_13470 [Falsochrobactrum shanghaiense]